MTRKSRFESALPRLIALGILAAIGAFVNLFALWFVLGVVALLLVVPKLIKRLIDPTVLSEWVPGADTPATEELGQRKAA